MLRIVRSLALLLWSLSRSVVLAALALAALYLLIGAMPQSELIASAHHGLAMLLTLLLYFGCLVSFSFCDNQASSVASSFPRHLFSLPVTSLQLTLWPVVFGALAMTLVWWLGAQIWQRDNPLFVHPWTSLLLSVSFMLWFQVWAWTPAVGETARTLRAGFLFFGAVGVLLLTKVIEQHLTVLLPILALQYGFGCYLALRGVKRSRCGDHDKRAARKPRHEGAVLGLQRYASPYQAQVAFERRVYRISVPVLAMLTLLMLFLSSLFALSGSGTASSLAIPIAPALGLYLLFSTQFATSWAAFNPNTLASSSGAKTRIPEFFAVLPFSAHNFAKAKLRACGEKTTISLLVLLAAAIISLIINFEQSSALYQSSVMRWGTTGTILLAIFMILIVFLFILCTTLGLLWVGLQPKIWPYFLNLYPVGLFFLILQLLVDEKANLGLPFQLNWTAILISLAAGKLVFILAFFNLLLRDGTYQARTLVTGLMIWLSAVAAIATVPILLMRPQNDQLLQIISGVMLMSPIFGFFYAPLALEKSRNR